MTKVMKRRIDAEDWNNARQAWMKLGATSHEIERAFGYLATWAWTDRESIDRVEIRCVGTDMAASYYTGEQHVFLMVGVFRADSRTFSFHS